MTLVSLFLRGLIWIYRHSLSLFMGRHCRFEPSCSAYADEAIQKFGPVKGSWLALKRIGRCHPWGGAGYDPVPNLKEKPEKRPNVPKKH